MWVRIFFRYFFFSLIFLINTHCNHYDTLPPLPGQDWASFTNDGAWCWFSDPRAIYHKGKEEQTYVAWVDSEGNIKIGAYNHKTNQIISAVLHNNLEKDDHDVPSILVRDDGHLLVFYSRHSKNDFYLIKSKYPENIKEWEPVQQLLLNDNTEYPAEYRRTYCYSNPYQLSGEAGNIFLFWRGINHKPNFSISKNGGITWSKGKILISPNETYKDQRPYVKYFSNYIDKIHFAFTDGHPRNEPTNSIYYMYYQNGIFFKADGKKIGTLDSLPIDTPQADLVYDGKSTNVRAWIWDIASGKNGQPVIVYTRLPAETDHRYHYAIWDETEWIDHEITPAGKWFPRTLAGNTEREPHYSGGIIIDKNDPHRVYLSRPVNGIFEIEKWITQNSGKSWTSEPITRDSKYDNIRPFVPWNLPTNIKPNLFWLINFKYIHYTDYYSAIKMNIPVEQ